MPQDQVLEVWGEFACFTRPELKVERFSYPVITPSAARGIYDAIYCKPSEFRWQITRIEVLAYPCYIALRRNEVKDKVPSERTILGWIHGEEPIPIWADGVESGEKGRTQRQTVALKNVHYRLFAHIHPWYGFEDHRVALEAQFRRRASKGKCIYQPYLGCREFPAYFELVEPGMELGVPLPLSLDVGLMLYDVFDLSKPGVSSSNGNGCSPSISLFRAEVKNGVLVVPEYGSDAVLRGRENVHA